MSVKIITITITLYVAAIAIFTQWINATVASSIYHLRAVRKFFFFGGGEGGFRNVHKLILKI